MSLHPREAHVTFLIENQREELLPQVTIGDRLALEFFQPRRSHPTCHLSLKHFTTYEESLTISSGLSSFSRRASMTAITSMR